MGKITVHILLPVLLFLSSLSAVSAQGKGGEDRDSLVRLVSANKASLVERNGRNFRKVEGNVVFLHNNTYLYCDSAYWNVDERYIDAVGHIVIDQEKTTLIGDSIKYVIDDNTARFRGHLVQLRDADNNILRTNNLDYNTKDSVASFTGGAVMKDKDGNLIESISGDYDSKTERFHFSREVEMFSDSMFFKCDDLEYFSDRNFAEFRGNIRGWYDANTLSSGHGWYDRAKEHLFFSGNVHALTEDYELWSDSLFYDRNTEYANLKGNVQLLDTVDNAIVLCGELQFWNSPRRAELYRDPALILLEENAETGAVDSTFMASDTLYYHTKRMFEVDSATVALARERREMALQDPLAGKKGSKPATGNTNLPMMQKMPEGLSAGGGVALAPGTSAVTVTDSLSRQTDTVTVQTDTVAAQADTLSVQTDSLATVADSTAILLPKPDTTVVSFVEAYHNVRIYRSDIQVKCDSLLFTSIDSIARLFKSPIIWYDQKNQVTADSMQFLMKDGGLDRGLLYSNSFVISEEQPGKYYHQIKSPEMIGYFNGSKLSRFDALGGVNAVFFIAEDSVITTVNKKDTRIMTAYLKDGELQRIVNVENVKSDAHPLDGMKAEEYTLKGFDWKPDQRPADRFSVTDRTVNPSRRRNMIPSPDFPEFRQAARFFEGYMDGIIREIDGRKPIVWLK